MNTSFPNFTYAETSLIVSVGITLHINLWQLVIIEKIINYLEFTNRHSFLYIKPSL